MTATPSPDELVAALLADLEEWAPAMEVGASRLGEGELSMAFKVAANRVRAAAALIRELVGRERDFAALQTAVVGETGQSAILVAPKMRDLTVLLASCKDPRTVSNTDEELDLFASIIGDAKEIHGDLYEGDDE